MEEQEKICRLCLKNCDDGFNVIERNSTKTLVFLLRISNLFINEGTVVCANCAKNIKDCSDFKRICLDVKDFLVEHSRNDDDLKLNVFNEDGQEMCRLCMGSLNIYSFTSSDSKLEDVALDQIMLNKCLPELDLLHVTEKLIICVPCRVSLQRYFGLITNFSIVEEKITKYCKAPGIDAAGLIRLKNVLEFATKKTLGKIDSIKIEDKFCGDEYMEEQKCNDELYPSENLSTNTDVEGGDRIKIEETFYEELDCKIEIKSEDLMKIEDHQSSDMPKVMIKREEDNGYQVDVIELQSYFEESVKELELKQDTLNRLQDGDISPPKNTNFNLPKMEEGSLPLPHGMLPQVLFATFDEKVKMHHCDQCSFQTKYKENLKNHLMIHEYPSEVKTTYQCEYCSYQTKFKSQLRSHLLTHKNPSQLPLYRCEQCSYQTKRKWSLKIHLLTHKNPSEIIMYQCEHCPFQTKHKSYIKKHLLNHQNPSKITMYQCEHCSFQTKHRHSLKSHLLTHKNPSEITMYQCEHCSFKTKYKEYIKYHLLRHKSPSEMTMYQCEQCSFQTKHKYCLNIHLVRHKNPSEVTMYRCEHCSFQTKHKISLKNHSLIHKNASEITMYECRHCLFQSKRKGDLKKHLLTHRNPSVTTVC